jgi:hypothetical protein
MEETQFTDFALDFPPPHAFEAEVRFQPLRMLSSNYGMRS